jgi:hypothetical protein
MNYQSGDLVKAAARLTFAADGLKEQMLASESSDELADLFEREGIGAWRDEDMGVVTLHVRGVPITDRMPGSGYAGEHKGSAESLTSFWMVGNHSVCSIDGEWVSAIKERDAVRGDR